MAQRFASEKYAKGVCDVCGFVYKLSRLKPTTIRGKLTGLRCCPDCWDDENPQDFLDEAIKNAGNDAEALRNPRPDDPPTPIDMTNSNFVDQLTMGAIIGQEKFYVNYYGDSLQQTINSKERGS